MHILQIILMIVQAVMMLFMLRALMQSANSFYYHHFTQAVIKLTDPVLNLLPFKNNRVAGCYFAGFAVASVLAFGYCFACLFYEKNLFYYLLITDGGRFQNIYVIAVVLSILTIIKTFGYLIIAILIAQALTSWLPSTRQMSVLLSTLTEFFVRPVQKVIPPIGMIDISLMVVILAIYAIEYILHLVFGILWMIP